MIKGLGMHIEKADDLLLVVMTLAVLLSSATWHYMLPLQNSLVFVKQEIIWNLFFNHLFFAEAL